MRLGLSGLYQPQWSAQIQEEWTRNVLKNRPDVSIEQLNRTVQMMNDALPSALVTGHEMLCANLNLPDLDDRHVLAAALRCEAEVIVTFNLKDFPAATLAAFDIQPLHPDEFIIDLWEQDRRAVLTSVQMQRASLKAPLIDARNYLKMMLRQGLPRTVEALEVYESML